MASPGAQSRQREPRKGRTLRRLRRLFSIFLVLFALVIGALMVTPPEDADEALIALERRYRFLSASLGLPLRGTPDLGDLKGRMVAGGYSIGAPIFMRIFKREFELELWMKTGGRFEHFATYPICRWSGTLGPKLKTGDYQAPEGVYTVDQTALNPNSRWHRSFNLGFPNAFDQSQGRTGSFLMVHGGCGSVGCYAMTNPVIDEIWQLVTAALDGGQKRFQVQVFPFRMTEENLARYAGHPWEPFWRSLKPAHDLFEADRLPPMVSVCEKSYAFRSGRASGELTAPIEAKCQSATPAGSEAGARRAAEKKAG